MNKNFNLFVIIGSASRNSANQKLIENFVILTKDIFHVTIFNDLKSLPHFDTELSSENTPEIISEFRNNIANSDGVLICTPEYVFSIPSGLKNAIEWCVSTTVFSDKPTGLITASAHGAKGHEELKLIMKTIMAKFNEDTTLLIHGIKGKINDNGDITESETKDDFNKFIEAYKSLIKSSVLHSK
ncbi:MAG: NAD(P)H-dependent oxidoreductase [Ignavibacteria bacterium]|nr:NAD(P)H-dependent oxidoreductase [Ignavibacteria bacterium]